MADLEELQRIANENFNSDDGETAESYNDSVASKLLEDHPDGVPEMPCVVRLEGELVFVALESGDVVECTGNLDFTVSEYDADSEVVEIDKVDVELTSREE